MIFDTTLAQMIVFFGVFAVGFVAARAHVVSKEQLSVIAQIATKVLLPVMIFYSTYANCSRDTILQNWQMVVLAALFYALISLVTFLIAKAMRLAHDKDRVFQLCFIFGNTGFVGVPLLAVVFPDAGLVYMMLFSIVDQMLFWTYGIWLSTERGHHHSARAHMSPRVFISPNTVSMVTVVAFVMLGIPVWSPLLSIMGTISSATPAVCMLYLGMLASFSNVRPVLKRPELYVGIVVKMIALPVALGKILLMTGLFPQEMVLALAMIAALPVMTVVPMLAAQNGHEGEYATGMTVISLVASLATIPLVVFLVGA